MRHQKRTGPGVNGRKLLHTLTDHQPVIDSPVKGYGPDTRAKRARKISQTILDSLLPSLSHKKE